ncbi:CshA/CshB family fibrillar adhesin-related protein [Parapedobacter sp. GCM10030251]|uniref:CshA/CshB family fibrillar adhesin-related protein n=1 Tax=Parapedobacter sp. GCM10030251 TaxID=3273419 RepID=UPI00361A77F8
MNGIIIPLTFLLGKFGLILGRVKLLIVSLVLFGLSLLAAQVFAQTQMKQATGGAGKYRNSIYWFDFAGLDMVAGQTRTYQFTANGVDITVVIDQLNNQIIGYRPGAYVDDRMDDLYNIGGADGANTLTNAIVNYTSGTQVSFRLSAYATSNGQPANIGLVFGNGEADAVQPSNEFTQGTTNGEPWRLLEAGVYNNTTDRQITFYDDNQTARLACLDNVALLYSQKTATNETNPLTINAVINGGGRTAMALGVMAYSERGDSPENYGIASHTITPSITGGTNPGSGTGNTVYIAAPPAGGQLITAGTVAPASTPKLGALPGDFDPSSFTGLGTNADADDLNGQDDEDGIVFEPLLTNVASYSIDAIVGNSSGSPAYLVGWIDFNKNGTFEEAEGAAATVANGATTATLNWTGLSGLTAGPTYARFRISTSPNLTVANPSGSLNNGETEDYRLTINEPVEICGNGIDDDGNGVADCDDPACNPYVNYFANGSLENYTQCPNLSALGTIAYVTGWKTSQPAPSGTGGQLMVNDPEKGCISPRPAASWPASTNLPAGSDGVAWAGMHGGAANSGLEDFQNTLIAPLPAGTYTFTFSAGYLVASPYTAPGFFRFYGVRPGEADFTTAHPLGDSPLINNALSSSNPTWKEYSFTFTSTEVYDRIYMVAYSGPAGQSYLVFDSFKMVYNPPMVGLQNPAAACLPDAIFEVKNPDPAWVSYQWYMDGQPILGATDLTYQPRTGQLGVFTVEAILGSGCRTAQSAGITLSSSCPVPFECNGSAYLATTPPGATTSSLLVINPENPTQVQATIAFSIPDTYNGIGYNFEDNLIYGVVSGTSAQLDPADMVRIDGTGKVTRLPRPTPLNATEAQRMATWTNVATANTNGARVNLAAGVVGLNNMYYSTVLTNNASITFLVKVDLTTMKYTLVRLSLNYASMSDIAFSPLDGMIYGVQGNRVVQTNPANGTQTLVTLAAGSAPMAGWAAGGAWNDVQGRVYFFANGGTVEQGGQRLYRYNPANRLLVNLSAVNNYPGLDATACFPTRMDKKVIMPAGGVKPGDVVEYEFSIYNGQSLPVTFDFEDVLTSTDLGWVDASVSPASPGGGTVSISGNTLRISGITVNPIPQTSGQPLTFRVSVKIADNASYNSCYTNQATIRTGNLTVYSNNPDTPEGNDPTAFCSNPCDVPAPISGGNLQACVSDLNGGKLTASATAAAGTQLIWYDAPTGGTVVTDPSLSAVGTVTYYAAADDGTCISSSRTPVTLNITATPILDEQQDTTSCGPFELPAIVGEHLSGNEAYYTAPNGGGTKYLPGDVISTPGTSTLYIFDQSEALTNCQGSLAVAPNTSYTLSNLFDDTHFRYPGTVDPAFWQGTGNQQILYNSPGTPSGGIQTYLGIIGDVSVGSTADCFGSEVSITAQVNVANQGPGPAYGYAGRLAIFNKATNQRLYDAQLPANMAANTSVLLTVTGTVPLPEVLAGNIAIVIVVETDQLSAPKNWLLSDFRASYQFLPETTQACSAETSFELTVNDVPAAPTSDGNQQACIADVADKLTATATAPTGATLIWYDAPVGGNAVTDPSLDTVGVITYYAEADNATCVSSTRTPVTLSIMESPVLSEVEDVVNCGPYELPIIQGEHLTGNEAYYTGTGGTGTKYLPGDVFSTLGTSTLYVYDATEPSANCAGSLSVSNNTKLTQDDMGGAYLYDVDNTNFWNGTASTTINYDPADPAWSGQTYKTIAGDINISGATECFGTQVQITAKVTVVNNGPGPGNAYTGQLGIWHNETNQTLYTTHLRSTPVGPAIDLTVTGVVPLADLAAGKLSFIVSLETLHGSTKSWTVSGFEADYQFLPETTGVCSAERSFELTINEAPAAPISGGNQQACIADLADKLTASATVPDGTQLVWYDAPVGGNVVTDPSLDAVGTVTYFAAANNGICDSPTRTPVTLSITASPVLDEIEDVAACEVFTLPEITGTGLSGNQAYYTAPNAGGTKYLPGDQLSSVGTTTLYVYDESGAVANCAGSLSVVANTSYPKADFDQLANQNTVMQYPRAINPAFWSGTGTQVIDYNAADPIVDDQTYPAIIGRVNIADTDDCFGTDVFISADVTVTNNGPSAGFGGVGYFSIINTATNTRLFNGGMPSSPAAGATFQVHVEGVVPVADVLAGNISIMIVVETHHNGAKNWTLSNFQSAYQFLPEVAQNCFDETSFEVTINEAPVLVITDPAAVCLPGTVDITASEVTQGSAPGLTFEFFVDDLAAQPLSNPEAISVSGTYYIKGTDPVTGCSAIAPVEVELIGQPELRVGQPFCTGGQGSIEVLSPLGPEFVYSIDGTNYQADPLFTSVAPNTYQVTAMNTVTGCVSEATAATIDPARQIPTPEVIQPDCSTPTGSIIAAQYAGATYSIDGGTSFVNSNVFTDLAPDVYTLIIRDGGDCDSEPVTVTINVPPTAPALPISGGDQLVCAENPVQTLTATATVGSGETLVWYDAPVGGSVVANPILNAIGTITYYAEATNGSCSSPTRTPVTLMIQSAPHIEPIENQEACEAYTLPEITGVNLTGNEAYYTEPGGGGQMYVAGDIINTVGTTNLYIFDRAEGQTNCAGSLSVVKTTKVSQADLETLFSFVPHYLTNTYDQGLWEGVSTAINYDATDPKSISQTYKTVVGDVVLTGSPACFGSAVRINPKVRITNNGADNGRGYAGRVSIVNNATNTEINFAQLTDTPVGSPVDIDIAGVVPVSDLVAGNISIVISVETYHTDNYIKDWTISDFSAAYQFIPESTESCFDEESFSVTIYEMPTAVAGADETQYNSGVFTLDAATPTVGTGEWSVVSGTPAVEIVDVTDPNAAITLDPNTSVTLRWTVTNGTCVAFDDVVLSYVSQADIETVKVTSTAGQTEFTPGESVDYTITVTNNGPSDAQDVNVEDTAPVGTTITNWTAVVTTGTVTLPATSGTGDINETIATLPNGAVVTYTVTVQTPPDFDDDLVNAVTVTTPTPDPDPTCDDCTTPPLTPDPQADVVTVKVVSDAAQTTFVPGESVDYTITVTNNGPSDATAVNVEDTAPAGTAITNWTAVVTTGTVTLPNTSGTGDINETIATLPNGAVVTYTVTVQTPPDFDDDLVNAVTVTTPTPDPDPTCDDCTTPPLTPDPQADVVTVKVVSDAAQTTFVPGESVDYTITVTNNGPSDATAVNVEDTAPVGTAITNWTAVVTTGTVTLPNTSGTGDINETIATLPNGAVVTYTVTVQTPPDFDDDLVNAVTVTTPTPDPDPTCDDCTTPPLTPDPQADVVTVKVVSDAAQTTFVPGESVDYTITVTNNGPSDAQDVNVEDTAPVGTAITNWTAVVTTGTVTLPNTSGTGDINETIATLPNGAVVTYTVTVQTPPDFDDDLVNAVTVTTPTPDPDPTCDDCTTPPLTPDPQADVVTVKVVSDAAQTTFVPGESVDYTITVTNNGPSDAQDVNVEDTAPVGTAITNWTAVVTTGTVTLPNTSGTGDINETIAALPNGAVVTYTVTVQTPPDFDDDLVNAVTVTTPTPDPDPTCDDCTTPPLTPDPQADIVTVKVVSDAAQTTFVPGESVDYTITVTNNGPSDATAVNVEDTAPAGTAITNWTAVVTTGTVTLPNTSGTGDINETIATLPNGAVVTYTVTVQTPPDFDDDLVNAVTVTTPTPDPDPTCDDCTTPPLTPNPQADVVTVKVVSDAAQTTFIPGESVDYTITVTNNGPSDAQDVNVEDTAPVGTTITNWTAVVTTGTVTLPATSGTGDLNETIPVLPNGAVVTYTVTVQTPSDFTGQLVNAVTVTTPTEDPDPTCDECETPPLDPDPQADIVTVKTVSAAGQTAFVPGESVDYTITVTNNGPSDATAVNVEDTAPAGTTITNWTAVVTTGTVTLPNTSGTGDLNETIPVLPNGAVVTYTVTVQTPSDFTGQLVNAVTATTPTEDPDPSCTQCTTPPLDPAPKADIVTVKTTSTAGQTEFTPGESVDYTITVTNNGPSDAVNVNVSDTAPAGTTITNWTAVVTTGTVTLPNASGSGDINETIATLPNGAVVTYTVTVRTPSDFTGQLVNAVTVTTPTEDPDPSCTQCTTPPLDPAPKADIVTVKITSTAGQTEFTPGESVDYTITVTNNGPSDATAVNINDTAPASTTITNWTAVVTTGTVALPATSGTGDLNETIPVLPNGAVVTYTVTVQTPSHFTGNLVNAVTVTTPTEDPDPTCADCETPPLTPDPQADIVTVKQTSTAGQTTFVPGESVEYTITVTNNGPSDAQNVNVVDTAPGGTTISGWTAVVTSGTVALPNISGRGNLNETIPTLPNGAVVTYTVTVQTPSDMTGDLVNTVMVTTPTPDPNPGCDGCTTPPLPISNVSNLRVSKTVDVNEAMVGTDVVFTIQVSNAGPHNASGVQVIEQLPSGYTLVSHEAGTGSYDAETGVWRVGNLANGAMASLKITATVNASGDYRNIAAVEGNERDPDESNNSDEVTVSPVHPPVASNDEIVGRSNNDLTIPIITNDNGSTYPLDPASIEIVSPPQNGTLIINPDGTVTFKPNPGYTGPVTFSYRVKDSAGNWSNIATVSITVEPNPLRIPNVFTPNGDGQNDRFEIIGIEAFDRVEVTIFNRWGNEVYKSRDYDNSWEGDDLNEGTYYYIIRLYSGTGEHEEKGWVLLKRK